MHDLVPWTLREHFETKFKKKKKKIVSIASNLTRLEIKTDRYIKSIVFATSFFHSVADKKRLRMFLTQFEPCITMYGKHRPK